MGCMLAGVEQQGGAARPSGCRASTWEETWWQQQKTVTPLHLTDSSPSDSVTNQVLCCSYTFISPSSPSVRPPPSPVCCFLFFPLSLQLQSWQIAFTLLHFRIIARSCHPEKVTIPTALRFNSSVSSVTDSINGENGPKDDAKKRKAADVLLDAFSLWSHCNTRGGLAVLRSAATF